MCKWAIFIVLVFLVLSSLACNFSTSNDSGPIDATRKSDGYYSCPVGYDLDIDDAGRYICS